MEYLYLVTALACIGSQFAVTKIYQKRAGSGALASFVFSFITAIASIVAMAVLCGFKIGFNVFSLLMACGILWVVLYTAVGMKMMSLGSVALYTMFLMMGGMLVPFLYGVLFLEEKLSVWKIIGMVLLIAALVIPAAYKRDGQIKNKKLFILLGVVVFLANGLVGVFNKTHQINEGALSTFEYTFWQNVVCSAVVFVLIAVRLVRHGKSAETKTEFKRSISQWPLILLFTAVCQSGSIAMLFAAKTIDAAVMFPVTTGGTMVVSSLLGMIFFKEKIDKIMALSLLLALVSTVLFVF